MSAATKTLLADAIVALHLGYVGFVVLGLVVILVGGLRGWAFVRRPVFRWAHLVCTLIVPVEALQGYECPLTTWERELRWDAYQTPEEISFMGRLFRDVLFVEASPRTLTIAYVLFAAAVIGAFLLVRPRRAVREPRAVGDD